MNVIFWPERRAAVHVIQKHCAQPTLHACFCSLTRSLRCCITTPYTDCICDMKPSLKRCGVERINWKHVSKIPIEIRRRGCTLEKWQSHPRQNLAIWTLLKPACAPMSSPFSCFFLRIDSKFSFVLFATSWKTHIRCDVRLLDISAYYRRASWYKIEMDNNI